MSNIQKQYTNKITDFIKEVFSNLTVVNVGRNDFDFQVAEHNLEHLPKLMELLDVGTRYGWRMSKSSVNLTATLERFWAQSPLSEVEFEPYHHVTHTQSVCANAIEGFLYEFINGDLSDSISEAESVFKSLQALVIAALYHDAGHTLGQMDDSVNITRAVAIYLDSKDTEGERDARAELLIRATQFPHSEDLDALGCTDCRETGIPYRQLALILRDADMMGSYTKDTKTLETLFVGLFLESKLKFPDLTVDQFNTNQKNFHANMVKWNTTWAKEKAKAMSWDKRHLEVAKVVNVNNPKLKALADGGVITF